MQTMSLLARYLGVRDDEDSNVLPPCLDLVRAEESFHFEITAVVPGRGSRTPRLAQTGCPILAKDQHTLLCALAAAQVGNEQVLDNTPNSREVAYGALPPKDAPLADGALLSAAAVIGCGKRPARVILHSRPPPSASRSPVSIWAKETLRWSIPMPACLLQRGELRPASSSPPPSRFDKI